MTLPFDPEKVLDDAIKRAARPPIIEDAARPSIEVMPGQRHVAADQAIKAMMEARIPFYQRSGSLVRVAMTKAKTADGAIIGTVLGSDDGRRGWINHLAVRRDHQHNGYGARLVQALVARLTAAGCEKLNLLVVNNNAHVVPFYESLGFALDDNLFMARWLRTV